MIEYINEPLKFDCEGEFGDGDGEEDGYENCLWESGGDDEGEEENEEE